MNLSMSSFSGCTVSVVQISEMQISCACSAESGWCFTETIFGCLHSSSSCVVDCLLTLLSACGISWIKCLPAWLAAMNANKQNLFSVSYRSECIS